MRRILMAGLLSIAVLVSGAGSAEAQQCNASGFPQHDMAGQYEAASMRVVIYPCGGISVAWNNAYGTHAAAYGGTGRLAGNGIMAQGFMPDAMSGGYLDGSIYLGIKAAERGWIEMGTYGPSPDPYNMPVRAVYRLQKQ